MLHFAGLLLEMRATVYRPGGWMHDNNRVHTFLEQLQLHCMCIYLLHVTHKVTYLVYFNLVYFKNGQLARYFKFQLPLQTKFNT